MLANQTEADAALQWLISRITKQARLDSVPLSDPEIKQLTFSNDTATSEVAAEAENFDSENDVGIFEAKITKLLTHAYQHDKRSGSVGTWENCLGVLRDHDVYLLVMVDQARIPRPKPSVIAALAPRSLSRIVNLLPLAAGAAVALCGFVYFIVLRTGSRGTRSLWFGNLAERLVPNESVRGLLFVVWIASVWLVGHLSRNRR